MKLCRWLVRGLGVAGLVLGGCAGVSASCRSRHGAPMRRPTVSSIVVQGNQRVEADTIRSYFRPGPGGRLDAVPRSTKASRRFRHRPVPGRPPDDPGRPAGHHRGRKPGDQPHRLRGQQEGQGRAAQGRNPVEGARHAVAPRRAGRRRSAWSKSTAAAAASTSGSSRRSSSCRTTASISSSRSPRAARPASSRSTSSATAPIRPTASRT